MTSSTRSWPSRRASAFVAKGYAEKHLTKGFSDPGAYSATINRMLEEEHASEIEEIQALLTELRAFTPLENAD